MTSSIGCCWLCFDLCLPVLSEDDTQTEAESSKCLLSSSPGAGVLIMTERTKHMEAGGCEMGRESIISGYLSLLRALLLDCCDGHAPDVYKTIITVAFVIRYIIGMSFSFSSNLR